MTAKTSDSDLIWFDLCLVVDRRFVAGIRFYGAVVHGITLTLKQSKVAALAYDATENIC